MYDVTRDVIDYFKEETRDEDEFQKVWAELVKWKADRDEEKKRQEEETRKRKEAQIKNEKLANLRTKAATAQAQYLVELFAGTSGEVTFDEVYTEIVDNYKKSEQVTNFVKSLEQMAKPAAEKAPDTCKCADKSKTDEEKLEEFLRKTGLMN